MMPTPQSFDRTGLHAPPIGTNSSNDRPPPGSLIANCGKKESVADADADPFDCWPYPQQKKHFHPYYDAKRIAAEFDEDQDTAREFFLPQYKALGAERDDQGALSIYERHRIIERQLADFYYYVVAPYAESAQRLDLGNELRSIAMKLYECRTSGPFGIGLHGRPVIAWEKKCGCSKLCPDESRHEAQRLYDRYADAISEHEKKGGRIYKVWPTLPNYPLGRLGEGKRHIFKRWRDKIVRARHNKKNRFPHAGSLMIQEDPLSAAGDWNVHLNGIVCADGWLSYADMREAWGCNIEIREHKLPLGAEQRAKSLRNLFNEMVKYPVIPVAQKSGDKHHTNAPALTNWSPSDVLEWHQANKRFRRTRAYGFLHGIGKPDRPSVTPHHWLGRVDWRPEGYHVTWRRHNLPHLVRDMLTWDRRALDLIRGDNSTTSASYKQTTGPP